MSVITRKKYSLGWDFTERQVTKVEMRKKGAI